MMHTSSVARMPGGKSSACPSCLVSGKMSLPSSCCRQAWNPVEAASSRRRDSPPEAQQMDLGIQTPPFACILLRHGASSSEIAWQVTVELENCSQAIPESVIRLNGGGSSHPSSIGQLRRFPRDHPDSLVTIDSEAGKKNEVQIVISMVEQKPCA